MTDEKSPGYQQVEQAWSQFRARDFQAAKESLIEARKLNKEISPPGVMLARMFFAANQRAAGRGALEKAIVDTPQDPEAYLLLADLCFRQSMVAAADLLYQRASDYCPRCPRKSKDDFQGRCYAGLASVAEARKQWKLAEDYLRLWMKNEPDNAVAQDHLGRALFRQAKYKEAWKVFLKLYQDGNTQLRPEISLGLLYEGLAYEGESGMREYAEKSMALARSRDPKGLQTRIALAKWALQTGRIDMARDDAKAAHRIDGASLQAKMLLGMALRYRKDYAGAEAILREIHSSSPAAFDATNQLALALAAQQDEKKRKLALQYAQLNARTHSNLSQPAAREAAATLGWVLFRLGRPREAQQNLRVAFNGGSLSADSQFYAAKVFAETKAANAARAILEPLTKSQTYFATQPEAKALWARLTKGKEPEKKQKQPSLPVVKKQPSPPAESKHVKKAE